MILIGKGDINSVFTAKERVKHKIYYHLDSICLIYKTENYFFVNNFLETDIVIFKDSFEFNVLEDIFKSKDKSILETVLYGYFKSSMNKQEVQALLNKCYKKGYKNAYTEIYYKFRQIFNTNKTDFIS